MRTTLIALALMLSMPLALASDGQDRQARRLDRITEKLDLSAQQRSQLEQVFEEMREKRKEMREQMREQMDARMAEVLSSEQLENWQALRGERHAKRRDRRREHRAKECDDAQSS